MKAIIVFILLVSTFSFGQDWKTFSAKFNQVKIPYAVKLPNIQTEFLETEEDLTSVGFTELTLEEINTYIDPDCDKMATNYYAVDIMSFSNGITGLITYRYIVDFNDGSMYYRYDLILLDNDHKILSSYNPSFFFTNDDGSVGNFSSSIKYENDTIILEGILRNSQEHEEDVKSVYHVNEKGDFIEIEE